MFDIPQIARNSRIRFSQCWGSKQWNVYVLPKDYREGGFFSPTLSVSANTYDGLKRCWRYLGAA